MSAYDELVEQAVLAYWTEMADETPLDRARKVGQLCGLSSSEVRNIVREHTTARVA